MKSLSERDFADFSIRRSAMIIRGWGVDSQIIIAIKSAKLARWMYPTAKVSVDKYEGNPLVAIGHPGTQGSLFFDRFFQVGFAPWESEKTVLQLERKIHVDGFSRIYAKHLPHFSDLSDCEIGVFADAIYATMIEVTR